MTSEVDTEGATANNAESPDKKIKQIESLILGEGRDNFQKFESLSHVFCPFEAVGMVRQEIKHSNYLAYILDPNRPHVFGTKCLEAFLSVIAESDGGLPSEVSAFDLYFLNISNVRVLREWRNIDLLIEIPNSDKQGEKGFVIAVEIKIDAQESNGQLKKYHEIIQAEYPANDWDKAFIFLTKDGIEASDDNSEVWCPVGLAEVVEKLEETFKAEAWKGPSADQLESYFRMVRRHILEDEKLENLAKQIWARHKDALNTLIDYRPNLQNEIFEELENRKEEFRKVLCDKTGFTICNDTSAKRLKRFYIQNWLEKYPDLKTGRRDWVESESLFAIEIAAWGDDRIRLSLVMGPGREDIRTDIHRAVYNTPNAKKVLKISRLTEKLPLKYKHYSAIDVLTRRDFAKYEKQRADDKDDKDVVVQEVINKIAKNAGTFLAYILPKFGGILADALQSSDSGEHGKITKDSSVK